MNSDNTALELKLPGAVSDSSGFHKLEHYYGIEFERGASNGGGDHGYHAMIGDETLLAQMHFHNMIEIAMVKNAKPSAYLNPLNWRKTKSGTNSVIDGADGSDIMQVFPIFYAIIGGTNPTYERYIVSDEEFSYDGDKAVKIEFHGETPDFATVWNGQARSIFNLSVAGSMGAGAGSEYSDTSFGNSNGFGFPKTQISRYTQEAVARAKNENTLSNAPYSNCYAGDLELVMALMYIECRTKNLNSVFGHGISSNVTPNEATWGTVSGARHKGAEAENWTYQSIGSIWSTINSQFPLLKIFEPQLAVSDKGGSILDPVYDSDGNKLQNYANNVMTGIFTKTLTFKYNNEDYEVVLRQPVWRGRSRLWGNIWSTYSGYEIINWLDPDGETVHNTLYRADSAVEMVNSTNESEVSLSNYDFIGKYKEVGDLGSVSGWSKENISLDGKVMAVAKGGGGATISNYESAYTYLLNSATEGKFVRRCSFFGGYASSSIDVLRCCFASLAPSTSGSLIGFGFRVTLSE